MGGSVANRGPGRETYGMRFAPRRAVRIHGMMAQYFRRSCLECSGKDLLNDCLQGWEYRALSYLLGDKFDVPCSTIPLFLL